MELTEKIVKDALKKPKSKKQVKKSKTTQNPDESCSSLDHDNKEEGENGGEAQLIQIGTKSIKRDKKPAQDLVGESGQTKDSGIKVISSQESSQRGDSSSKHD